jgi:hypothetical protein
MVFKSFLQPVGISFAVGILVLVLSYAFVYQHGREEAIGQSLYDFLFRFNNNDGELLSKNTVTLASLNAESSQPPSSTNQINFRNVTNLTDNPQDSVYGQIATVSGNNVYMIWQDSMPGNNIRNYDVFFKKSNDSANTFSKEVINLSNNNGFSEHPQIAASGNNVYIVWADNSNSSPSASSTSREILFVRSTDGGNTFSNPVSLSEDTRDSYNQEIFAFGDNVYVVWLDKAHSDSETANNILFKSSADAGATFSQTLTIGNNANDYSFPKLAAYNDQVYAVWNVEGQGSIQSSNRDSAGLFFVKSSNQGSNFGEPIKLNYPEQEFGEAQIAASGQSVYVVWGGSHLNTVSNIFLTKSIDTGETFSDPIAITDDDNSLKPSNVEIVIDQEEGSNNNSNNLYIAWQDVTTTEGENNKKEEVLFKMSSDNGYTFHNTINLSKNHDISECPSLAVDNNKVYVIWEDLSPGNHEVLFTRST